MELIVATAFDTRSFFCNTCNTGAVSSYGVKLKDVSAADNKN